MIDRPIRLDQSALTGGELAPNRYSLTQSRTTQAERLLLLIAIVILPLQDFFPALAGMSVMFLIYCALGAYIIVNRRLTLGKIWCDPCFIAAYIFIGVSALLEFSSPLSGYEEIIRFAQMIGGAVCVAVLCRDRSALAVGLYGYIVTALWVSIVLYLTSYGVLQGMQADDFDQASKVRAQAFGDKPMGANINGLAMWCTQGAIVAFALSLSPRFRHLRILLVGIATFCLIASFLPMSRGAAVASLVSFAVILYAHGFRQGKALVLVCLLGIGIYVAVPDAVWSRMGYSTEVGEGGRMEARASLYTAALNRLPEYIVSGVGAGNFHKKWGLEKGFARHHGDGLVAQGAHNALIQITIYWGVLGLVMFLWIIWCIYRSIPLRCGRDELSLALLGIIVSLGLFLLQTHGFYAKQFTFGLGLLVGTRQWICTRGAASAVNA